MAGLQCPKRLYLSVHPPELFDEKGIGSSLPIINGNAVGNIACQLYPGVMVEYVNGFPVAVTETKRLIADDTITRIHEATFSYDNVLVRVDLLERSDSGWIITEVKGSTSVKPHYISDAAIQAWVLQGCGLKLASVKLMYVNSAFIYQGDDDYQGLLHVEDVSEEVFESLSSIGDKKVSLMKMLTEDMPDIEMGEQCRSPFDCEFISTCQTNEQPEYPISVLPRCTSAKKKELIHAGYNDIRDIPDGILTNHNHQRVWRATCVDKEEIDKGTLILMSDWGWPRYYVDFETIGLAVPSWEGVKPYMQVPFQWSCHIHHVNGEMDHVEFLDVTGNDPRRACAELLVNNIGKEGVLVAYNAAFEKRVIRDLARMYPDLSDSLLEMNERFVDLLIITRSGYYHPSQKGSWSLKAVLPALVPELNYSDLEAVQNGGDAQLAWVEASNATDKERMTISGHLLEYCKFDTWAMVKIVDALLKKLE
jgi:hypothetical protein